MIISENNWLRHKKGLLFVNRKKQKNYANLVFSCARLPTVDSDLLKQKLFASFFQKRCFFFSLNIIRGTL